MYDANDNVGLLMKQKPAIKNCQILPAGKYLTAYHVGHWNTIGETYERILNYKKQHQLKTSDLYIEYDVVNNFITKNEIYKKKFEFDFKYEKGRMFFL